MCSASRVAPALPYASAACLNLPCTPQPGLTWPHKVAVARHLDFNGNPSHTRSLEAYLQAMCL